MSACAAAKRIPPPGWTTPESGAGAASPLDLSRFAEGKYFSTPARMEVSHFFTQIALQV